MMEKLSLFPMIYQGVCLDNNDPETKGRLKVFVPGVHPQAYASNPSQLPWAVPLMPIWGGSYKNPTSGCLNDECGHTSVPFVEKDETTLKDEIPSTGSVPSPDKKVNPFKGAQLAVFFMNGDHNYPVYFGAYQSGPGWLSDHKDHHVSKTKNVTVEIDEGVGTANKLVTVPAIAKATRVGQYLYGRPEKDATNGATVIVKELPTRVHLAVSNTEEDGCSISIELTGHVNIKVKGDLYQEVDGEKIETVTGNYHLNVSGDMYTTVGGTYIDEVKGPRLVHSAGRVTVTNCDTSMVDNLGDHWTNTYGDHQVYATNGISNFTLGTFRQSDNGYDSMHGGSYTEYANNDRNVFTNSYSWDMVGSQRILADDGVILMRGGVVGSTTIDMSTGPINEIETSPTVNKIRSASSVTETAVAAVNTRMTAAENAVTDKLTELVTGEKGTTIGGWYESTIMGGLTNNVQGFFEEHIAGPVAEFFEGAKLSTVLGIETTANAALSTKKVAAPFVLTTSNFNVTSTGTSTIMSTAPMLLKSEFNVIISGKQIHLN